MHVVYNHKAIATAEFADEERDIRYRLTVTRVNSVPTARFELDGFNGDSDYAVPLCYLQNGTWLEYAATLPAEGLPVADIANTARACFEQVMAM